MAANEALWIDGAPWGVQMPHMNRFNTTLMSEWDLSSRETSKMFRSQIMTESIPAEARQATAESFFPSPCIGSGSENRVPLYWLITTYK